MAIPKAKNTGKVPVSAALVKALTLSVKKHLLDNGVEPAVVNDAVLRAALQDYNASIDNASKV